MRQSHYYLLLADGELGRVEVEDPHALQVLGVWFKEDASIGVKGWHCEVVGGSGGAVLHITPSSVVLVSDCD